MDAFGMFYRIFGYFDAPGVYTICIKSIWTGYEKRSKNERKVPNNTQAYIVVTKTLSFKVNNFSLSLQDNVISYIYKPLLYPSIQRAFSVEYTFFFLCVCRLLLERITFCGDAHKTHVEVVKTIFIGV